jgi:hypothetical protein
MSAMHLQIHAPLCHIDSAKPSNAVQDADGLLLCGKATFGFGVIASFLVGACVSTKRLLSTLHVCLAYLLQDGQNSLALPSLPSYPSRGYYQATNQAN